MRTLVSDYEIVHAFKHHVSFSIPTCTSLRVLANLKNYSLREVLDFLEEYRLVSKANGDSPGFKDYPNWERLSVQDQIAIRRMKASEFLNYLSNKIIN